jgi:chitinase
MVGRKKFLGAGVVMATVTALLGITTANAEETLRIQTLIPADRITFGETNAPTPTTIIQTTTKPAPPVTGQLPTHTVVGYWQNWGGPNVRLRDVPQQYNVVALAFAVPSGSNGAVTFTPGIQSDAEFIADVDLLRSQGRKVILSAGGWGANINLSSPDRTKAFVDSMTALIKKYHLDGFDWDVEEGAGTPPINVKEFASASRQIQANFGDDFLITMAPMQGDNGYYQLAEQIKDILDLVNPQYYNGGQFNIDYYVSQSNNWMKILRPDQVGMGFMAKGGTGDTGYVEPSVTVSAYECITKMVKCGSVKPAQAQPTFRGVMTWSINHDASTDYAWVKAVSPAIK